MKKKGFTLIELIVVIAIIGVLAAILVPAMLGYVKKSKVTTNNTTAKSIFNAFNTTITDLDSADKSSDIPTANVSGGVSGGSFSMGGTSAFQTKVQGYFSDIVTVDAWEVQINSASAVQACAVHEGRYTGTYPRQMDPDDSEAVSTTAMATLLSYAVSGRSFAS